MDQAQHLVQHIIPIIKNAGIKLASFFKKEGLAIRYKESGLVTEADTISEAYLMEKLSALLPEASFICEESGVSGASDYSFIIDPLDGTTNFVHGIPYFCISVALTYKGKPILGFIYEPINDELFYAIENKGAYLNNKQIRVASVPKLDKAVIASNNFLKEQNLELLSKIKMIACKCYSFRQMGSIALDIAYVASARLDGLILTKFSTWDIAAGLLLLVEAEAAVTSLYNERFASSESIYIAANKDLHAELIRQLSL